jgi:replicative DNA helicase
MNDIPNHEYRILSYLLAGDDHEALSKATARGVIPEYFTDPGCREMFVAVLDLAASGKPVAVDTVAQWLVDHGRLQAAGGWPAITERSENPPLGVYIANDLDRLCDEHTCRLAQHAILRAGEILKAPDAGDPKSRYEAVQPLLRAAMEAGHQAEVRDLKAIAKAAILDLKAERAKGVPGPFPDWDRGAGTLLPGDLAVLAARPGGGKTALALQHVLACVRSGRRAAVFSLEMNGEQLCQRLARQSVGSNATDLESAEWLEQELPRWERLLHILDGKAASKLSQIEARSRLLAGRRDAPLGMIVVDYLQLITPPGETLRENRERQVAHMSRALKLLAGELNVPVLLLSQLNREVEKDERRPRLTDLRESGSIEQDADAVWFLHPDKNGPRFSDADSEPVTLIQAKRRNGPAGAAIGLMFQRRAVRFIPVARTSEQQLLTAA